MAGLNGMIRKMFGDIFAERLVLDAKRDATPAYSPLYLYPTGAPTNGAEGAIYVNDSGNSLEFHNGTAWQTLASLDLATAQTFAGPVNVTGGLGGYKKVEVLTGATDTWEATDSGTLFVLSRAGGIDVTLPAIAAAQVGVWFDVVVGTAVSGDSYTITAATGDLLTGRVLAWDTDTTYGTTSYAPDGSDDLIITLNATTTGGGVGGDQLRLVATSATSWLVTGQIFHTGDTATPFS